jgi:hypothetical protein
MQSCYVECQTQCQALEIRRSSAARRTGSGGKGVVVADEPTCGKGLAARSTLPTQLGKLMDAVAEVLEIHTKALDPTSDNGQREDRAYRSLVARHRQAADLLRATGEEMAGYRDLPMADHDTRVLNSAEAVEAFARVVAIEHEVSALLHDRLGEDDAMLTQMCRK